MIAIGGKVIFGETSGDDPDRRAGERVGEEHCSCCELGGRFGDEMHLHIEQIGDRPAVFMAQVHI